MSGQKILSVDRSVLVAFGFGSFQIKREVKAFFNERTMPITQALPELDDHYYNGGKQALLHGFLAWESTEAESRFTVITMRRVREREIQFEKERD